MIHGEYLSDTKLSLAARGLMATMLYLKKNKTECSFSIKGLAPHVQDTEYQVAKMLKELEKKGYLIRKRICQNGRVLRWDTIFNGSKLSDEDKTQSFLDKNSNPVNKIKNSFNSKRIKKAEPQYENKDMDISADSVISNEPSNKENTNVNPCVEIQDVGVRNNMIDRLDNINNNTCIKSINQSLVNLGVNVNDCVENQNVENYREIIKENISYDYLCDVEDTDEVNCIVDIITDVVCADEKSEMRVAKRNIPVSILKSLFLKLSESHIQYVLANLRKTSTDIRNIKAYLITSLYNAIQTLQLHLNADVRNCLYGKQNTAEEASKKKTSYDPNEVLPLWKRSSGLTVI